MTYTDYLAANSDYVSALLHVYGAWKDVWVKKLARSSKRKRRRVVVRGLRELINGLQDVAVVLLPSAYLIGLHDVQMTPHGNVVIGEALSVNRDYLISSLVPDIQLRLQELDDLDEWVEDAIVVALAAFDARVAIYAQRHWVTIWDGFEEYVDGIVREEGRRPRVARRLDPQAKHCRTCPLKAAVYDSWEAMIRACGGVPGSFDADDECGPGCRCYLQLVD